MSKTSKEKVQRFQNSTLRKFTRSQDEDNQATIEELHEKYNLTAINVRMHRRATKTWNKLRNINRELTERSSLEDDNDLAKDHYWWNRVSPYVNMDEPAAWYSNSVAE